MHIPDGYLSPATAGALYAVSAPFWYFALRRVRHALTRRTVPALALFAAFSFVLMMFNIPLPGGTTGHAVGGTLLAIVLGPWAAVLGISVVLGIQALFFGDGGLLTFAANCFNMAIVLPLVGYFVYKAVSVNSEVSSPRRLIAAAVGSYVAIVAAALATGIEFGIQPVLFHASDGTPLYAPYSLGIAIPAMLVGHLLVAGPAEAIVTGGIFAYLQRTRSRLIGADTPGKKEGRLWLLWGALGLLAVATPLGLLASGTAWGEWGIQELESLGLGFIPLGLERLEGWWPAPLQEYTFTRVGAAVGYVVSAFLGIAIITLVVWLISRWVGRRSRIAASGRVPRMNGRDFLSRNISNFAGALESIISSQDLTRVHGMLQLVDPRVKLMTTLLFIVVVGLARSVPVLCIMFAFALGLALASRIPLRSFLKRLVLFVPFTAVIALPALFVTQGQPLVSLAGHVTITEQGARTAGLLILRVIGSVSLGMLLILTTPWNNLLAAFRWIRVPAVVVDILRMTYRYVFLFLRTANSMFLARRSRLIAVASGAENRRWLGHALATTMHKSQHLSEEVYLAMLSRGYQGDVRVMDHPRLKLTDFLWAVFALAASLTLLLMERL